MRIFLLFLLSILIVALQLTVLARLSILAVAPNFILAGVLAWAIYCRENKKDWLILIPVLFFDLIAGQPFGLATLSLWLVFFCLKELGVILFKQNDLPAIFSLTFLGILLFEFFQILLSHLFSVWHLMEPISLSAFYFYAVLPINLLYNGILSLLILWGLNKSRLFNNDDGRLAKFE